MTILAIETSCDETAVAILRGRAEDKGTTFDVLGNALLSQIEIHKPYGGVYPMLAKREHAKNLAPLVAAALEEAELLREDTQALPGDVRDEITRTLEREPELADALLALLDETEIPAIDAIAVTKGPGLEPALWVGMNAARALARAWQKPLIGINHMEGHIFAGLAAQEGDTLTIPSIELPLLALLVSGGHTELVSMSLWRTYSLVGQTRDDAVGEAFDKVARQLGLPYPGGPEISRLAERSRARSVKSTYRFPRPMLDQDNFDFSFSGLKTEMHKHARTDLSEEEKEDIARGFEDAVVEVLIKKTLRALHATGSRTLVIGGGVSANNHLRASLAEALAHDADIALYTPDPALATDNAIMIALAGYFAAEDGVRDDPRTLRADGNLALAN